MNILRHLVILVRSFEALDMENLTLNSSILMLSQSDYLSNHVETKTLSMLLFIHKSLMF